jgi:REP element-mobilizing transposase RayT
VLANHVIFGVYGFWLPNDPRGSWSKFVGSWELFRYGRATKTIETRSLAARPHDRAIRVAAKSALKRNAVLFSDAQIRAVAEGFDKYVVRAKVSVLACAILRDHVHLVIAEHRLSPAQLAIQFKGAATRALVRRGLHPFSAEWRPAKCFARGEWKVYLDTEEDVFRAIEYVERNPEKEGLPRQDWAFVVPAAPRRPR